MQMCFAKKRVMLVTLTSVADSSVPWRHPVLEGNAAILRSLLFLRAESGITVNRIESQETLKNEQTQK